jgi:aminodeoxyfutalosine synthase
MPLDPALQPIRAKVAAGQRLDRDDGLRLFRTRDLFTLGELADLVRRRLHGRRTYYVINRHINYTNYCVLRCKFCSFYRPYGASGGAADGGYEQSIAEIVSQAAEAVEHGATEIHVVGGLHPKLPFSYYTDLCRAIKARCPAVHLKAFTAIEIVHFTRISRPRLSVAEVLTALREAGLDSLPGGGAEIFDDRVHDEAYRNKVGAAHWFDVHRTAHELGIPSNATMLYGHIESIEERVDHMLRLREHQDQSLARMRSCQCKVQSEVARDPPSADQTWTGGKPGSRDCRGLALCTCHSSFQCFVPLAFVPDGSALAHLPGPTGLDDLRTLAVSRLMLDNIPHLKSFWIMHSPKLAQVALSWGVDDFDGTVVWYDITKREGRGTNRQELTVPEIRRLIREAGGRPVRRDSLYRPLSD